MILTCNHESFEIIMAYSFLSWTINVGPNIIFVFIIVYMSVRGMVFEAAKLFHISYKGHTMLA